VGVSAGGVISINSNVLGSAAIVATAAGGGAGANATDLVTGLTAGGQTSTIGAALVATVSANGGRRSPPRCPPGPAA